MSPEEEKKHEVRIRESLLEKIEDLKEKIETNADFPEAKQTISDLLEFDERIDECLNCWYY